jgi:hypothetical protein
MAELLPIDRIFDYPAILAFRRVHRRTHFPSFTREMCDRFHFGAGHAYFPWLLELSVRAHVGFPAMGEKP